MLIAERVQNERLRQIIKELQRHRFGRRAETLPEDQMLLGLEEVEQVAASGEADIDAGNPAERASRSGKRRMNRGSLPAHLPRVEMEIDIEDHACPCCGTRYIGSARIRASGSTSCRRSSVFSSFAGPNMPAGLART
jgi:transposase